MSDYDGLITPAATFIEPPAKPSIAQLLRRGAVRELPINWRFVGYALIAYALTGMSMLLNIRVTQVIGSLVGLVVIGIAVRRMGWWSILAYPLLWITTFIGGDLIGIVLSTFWRSARGMFN